MLVNGSTNLKLYSYQSSIQANTEVPSSKVLRKVLYGETYTWTPYNLSTLPAIWTNPQNLVVDESNRISQATNIGTLASTNFAQSTDVNKPTLSSGAMSFDGNDFLSTTNRSIAKNKSKVWIFAISRVTDISTNRGVFFQSHNSTTGFTKIGLSYIPSNMKMEATFRALNTDALTILSANFSINTTYMCLVSIDIGSKVAEFYLDGVKVDEKTIPTSASVFQNTDSMEDPVIGGILSQSPFIGSILDFMYGLDVIPTITEIDKIFGWAAHKYGLTASLPSNHPYKTKAP